MKYWTLADPKNRVSPLLFPLRTLKPLRLGVIPSGTKGVSTTLSGDAGVEWVYLFQLASRCRGYSSVSSYLNTVHLVTSNLWTAISECKQERETVFNYASREDLQLLLLSYVSCVSFGSGSGISFLLP